MLNPADVKDFYDRFGSRQDRQGFYEDAALEELSAHADFRAARAIVEFGCGTGRFAHQVLSLATDATYVGLDVSTTMVQLARARLAPFGPRARVDQLEAGSVHLPIGARAADRIISTYVLDLLPATDIATFCQEARRVLSPEGRLCLISLTPGVSPLPRLVSRLWDAVFRLRPSLVGGCRPISLSSYCDRQLWDVEYHRTVSQWALSSEVLIVRPHAT